MDLPPRKAQAQLVQAALKSPRAPPIFLHGPPSTAILPTLQNVLSYDTEVIHIDCVLSHTDRLLFSAILQDRATADPSEFVEQLSDSVPSGSLRIFIFERAERLAQADFGSSIVSILFRLPELTGLSNIRSVFISRTPWLTFRNSLPHDTPSPQVIFFPPFNERECCEIVTALYKPRLHADFVPESIQKPQECYKSYVKSVVTVLYPATSDVFELQRVSDDLYPQYLSGLMEHGAAIPAFNRIRDDLKEALHRLYRRELVPRDKQVDDELNKRRKQNKAFYGLSRAALTLLVAAFLASRNPPAHDLRYFTSARTRERGGKKGRGRPKKSGGGPGPDSLSTCRVFALERLLAIFAAIGGDPLQDGAEECVSNSISTSCLVHISTLVGLHYIARERGGDALAEPRFRCNISQETATHISNVVGIELHQYLHKEW